MSKACKVTQWICIFFCTSTVESKNEGQLGVVPIFGGKKLQDVVPVQPKSQEFHVRQTTEQCRRNNFTTYTVVLMVLCHTYSTVQEREVVPAVGRE
jgi:hypothetical protein